MKKIMFKDKCGLTKSVLDGRNTMTRRIAYCGDLEKPNVCYGLEGKHKDNCVLCDWNKIIAVSAYKVGEVVAIAQAYQDCGYELMGVKIQEKDVHKTNKAGWKNKMFVKASLMKHHIRITNIRVERLQDISHEDCLQEGVRLRSEPSKYQEVWSPEYTFGDGKYHAKYPRAAFVALIDKVLGKGTWERNPYVFVYEFELVD